MHGFVNKTVNQWTVLASELNYDGLLVHWSVFHRRANLFENGTGLLTCIDEVGHNSIVSQHEAARPILSKHSEERSSSYSQDFSIFSRI